jgi:hypothetical protein
MMGKIMSRVEDNRGPDECAGCPAASTTFWVHEKTRAPVGYCAEHAVDVGKVPYFHGPMSDEELQVVKVMDS